MVFQMTKESSEAVVSSVHILEVSQCSGGNQLPALSLTQHSLKQKTNKTKHNNNKTGWRSRVVRERRQIEEEEEMEKKGKDAAKKYTT